MIHRFQIAWFLLMVIVSKLILSLFLPTEPSELAPDEGTYAELASWISKGYDVQDFPGYGEYLYSSTRTLILPSSLLVDAGVPDLFAVRTISALYHISSIYIFHLLLCFFFNVRKINEIYPTRNLLICWFALLVFSFLPSLMIWASLGLTDTASIFWSMAIFFLVVRIACLLTENRDSFRKYLYLIFIILASVFSYISREQTATLFTVSLLLSILIFKPRSVLKIAAPALMIGMVIGLFFSTYSSHFSSSNGSPDREVSVAEVISISPIAVLESIETISDNNRRNAKSAIAPSTCIQFLDSVVSRVSCNLSELPYRLSSFLFRPLPFIDAGSLTYTFASLENVFWILLVGCILLTFRSPLKYPRNEFVPLVTFLYNFIFSFSILASLYEGNLGTAFRHKSTILWCLLLVLTIQLSQIDNFSRNWHFTRIRKRYF